LLSRVCQYYLIKRKEKKRKTIFKRKRKEKENNDLADLPSHDKVTFCNKVY